MNVTELDTIECEAWDAYVRGSPHGLPHHLSAWRRILSEVYGFRTPYLLARDGGRIAGVLPMYIVRSVLVGRSAFSMQGGLVADNEDVALALIQAGIDVARRAGLNQFVLQDTRQVWPGDLHTVCHHVHYVVPISSDEQLLWKGIKGNVRRLIRRGREQNVTVEIDRDGKRLDTFYDLMSRFTHQMGTPVFSRRFAEGVFRAFPGEATIYIANHEGRPVAAYLALAMAGTVHILWAANLREHMQTHASYVAYWEICADIGRRGYTALDMGRSPIGSGPAAFKKQWNTVEAPVSQQIAALDRGKSTESITGRVYTDSKFRLFTQAWTRVPYFAHQLLGPRLRRHVPFA